MVEEEKLGEPDNEDGFDGDVHGSFTAYIFEYVETMALNDVVYIKTRTVKETYEEPWKSCEGENMMASKIMSLFRSCAS